MAGASAKYRSERAAFLKSLPQSDRRTLTVTQRRLDRIRANMAVGGKLTRHQHIHHHSKTQLVICDSADYHRLLHKRERVLRLGGNPNTQDWCYSCRSITLSFTGNECDDCEALHEWQRIIWNANVRILQSGHGVLENIRNRREAAIISGSYICHGVTHKIKRDKHLQLWATMQKRCERYMPTWAKRAGISATR